MTDKAQQHPHCPWSLTVVTGERQRSSYLCKNKSQKDFWDGDGQITLPSRMELTSAHFRPIDTFGKVLKIPAFAGVEKGYASRRILVDIEPVAFANLFLSKRRVCVDLQGKVGWRPLCVELGNVDSHGPESNKAQDNANTSPFKGIAKGIDKIFPSYVCNGDANGKLLVCRSSKVFNSSIDACAAKPGARISEIEVRQ